MKKLVILILVFSLITSIINVATVYAEDEIKVVFNENVMHFDVKPYAKDGRTMVPFRKILEAFGAEVGWDGEQKIVSAKSGGTEIYLKLGANYAYVNGYKVNLDVAPESLDGRTFVPLRFISENLGAEVTWEGTTRTVTINYNDTKYKLGQQGSIKGLTFSIDSSDGTSTYGILTVKGKISSADKSLTIEVSDDLGYVLSEPAKPVKKPDGTYEIDTSFNVPTCHNFIAKRIILKMLSDEQKQIKIAEYDL